MGENNKVKSAFNIAKKAQGANGEKKQLTGEQIKKIIAQLQEEVKTLKGKLNAIDMTALRLNYLFRVVDLREAFGEEFVASATAEIQDILTVPSEGGCSCQGGTTESTESTTESTETESTAQ